MSRQIFYHYYKLKRIKTPNSVTQDTYQHGALIKIVDKLGNFGVADICPWVSLGDLSLSEEILQKGPLYQRAYELAEIDLQARKNKIQLNQAMPVQCHSLVSEYKNFIRPKEKIDVVKIKGDNQISDFSKFLNQFSDCFNTIRIDFNSCLTEKLYQEFCENLKPEVIKKIECIEDPFPFDLKSWSKSTLPLASDFQKSDIWPTRILKPSRQRNDFDFKYMTSSMDHPIGLAHGLIEAQKYPDMIHGFLTLDFYEHTLFHQFFSQTQNSIYYRSDGYGIGFEKQLNQLIWEPTLDFDSQSENHIFINHQLDEQNKKWLWNLVDYFQTNISKKGYFLISSSGSTQTVNSSLKIYAIKKDNFLNSAQRVNKQFNLSQAMNWGCVLPTYHVGGLAILARAQLAGAKVFISQWKDFSVDWLNENQIQIISLVPSQVYDLVTQKIRAPEVIKFVFIGASQISKRIQEQAQELGWPLIITFGMTETSSMFAWQKDNNGWYSLFEGVIIKTDKSEKLILHIDSIASYCLQKNNEQISCQKINETEYETQDHVSIENNRFKFIKRNSENFKINGFNVSLNYLREVFFNLNQNMNWYLTTTVNNKNENQITLLSFNLDVQNDIEQFNQIVLSHEKIKRHMALDQPLPRNELGKIVQLKLDELIQKDKYVSKK